jgi:hypothetical protein
MTSAGSPEIYPQYCFNLSPNIGEWCHLRIADVVALTAYPGFEGGVARSPRHSAALTLSFLQGRVSTSTSTTQ